MLDAGRGRAAALIMDQLPEGAFLCVDGDVPNVMTVGWGGISYFWRKDVFIAPVRRQRHTYELLQKAGAFTLCVPKPGEMRRELALAGSLSGRDGDKFAAIGLQWKKARASNTPVIPECALILECVVRARNDFTGDLTDSSIIEYTYAAGDFHTLFYGEIVARYEGAEA